MPEYLVEAYYSPDDQLSRAARPEDVAIVADQLTSEGRSVRLVQAIFASEDESCFYLFDAGSERDVSEAAARSGLRFQRLVGVTTVSTSRPTNVQDPQGSQPSVTTKENDPK